MNNQPQGGNSVPNSIGNIFSNIGTPVLQYGPNSAAAVPKSYSPAIADDSTVTPAITNESPTTAATAAATTGLTTITNTAIATTSSPPSSATITVHSWTICDIYSPSPPLLLLQHQLICLLRLLSCPWLHSNKF